MDDYGYYIVFGKARKKVPFKWFKKIPLLNRIKRSKKFEIEFVIISHGFFSRDYLNSVTRKMGYDQFVMTNVIEIDQTEYLIYTIEIEDEQDDNSPNGFQAI